jgi:hypothetical protein
MEIGGTVPGIAKYDDETFIPISIIICATFY